MKVHHFLLYVLLACFGLQIYPVINHHEKQCLAQKKCVRGGGPWGFFAEFLWVLNHLEYCKTYKKIPVVYWGEDCAYYSQAGYEGSENCWEYYFEPVSSASYDPKDQLFFNIFYPSKKQFTTLWWYVQYIDNKHLLPAKEQESFKPIEDHAARYASPEFDNQRVQNYPVGKYHLYSHIFRKEVKETIIDRYIKIKPSIQEKIDNFYNAYIKDTHTISIHLRGKHLGNEVLPIDLSYIFQEANNHAVPGTQFFIATDQISLLQEAKKALHGPVIYYECERFDETTSPYPGKKLHPILGENIVIEMMLLSQCNHFVHTLSNVSTAVLYFNPTLSHSVVY
jgi:hypothetical protein